LAFQLADDLLDLEGEPTAMGKAARKDERKATLVAMLGAEAAKQQLAALERDAIAALTLFGAEADGLREAAAFVVRRES
jgi:farnesyl diphosphate synthase